MDVLNTDTPTDTPPPAAPSKRTEPSVDNESREKRFLSDDGLTRRLRFASYSPVISLSLLVASMVVLVCALLWAMRWVDHTNRVIEQGWYVQKLALDLQTSTRGYLLTGDMKLLRTFDASDDELPRAMKDLRQLVQDNDRQRGRVDRVQKSLDAWLIFLGEVFRSADPTAGVRPPAELLQNGSATFDEMRGGLETFIAEENALRAERTARVDFVTRLALIGAAVLTVLVAIWQCRAMRSRIVSVTTTYREALRLAKDRRDRIRELLRSLDRELAAVGEIQRSLLPVDLPQIDGLDLAASYQTSSRAGGDYFDFFPLAPTVPGGPKRWGILIADVSGHGTPAAVLMAVTHSIAHGFNQPEHPPSDLLYFVNRRLCESYTSSTVAFVTAFYAIYDPASRRLSYSSAGHNPPRLRRAEQAWTELDDAQGLPLGVMLDADYESKSVSLDIDDTLIIYTDGITEARDPQGEFFGVERIDSALLDTQAGAQSMLDRVLTGLRTFSHHDVTDDQTLLIVKGVNESDPALAPRQSLFMPSSAMPMGR